MKKYIKIPIFNQRIYITDKKNVEKYLPNVSVSDYGALCYIGKRNRVCIYLNKKDDITLVHESVHLANFICDRCMLKYTIQEDELLAYLTSYIYRELKKVDL